MKFARYIILFSLLWISTVRAGSMKFFPGMWDLWMYCIYSGEIRINTHPHSVSAIDTRIFATNIDLVSFTGQLFSGTFTHLWTLWRSIMAMSFYPSNSVYRYINRYASDLDHLLDVGDTSFFSYLFVSTWLNTSWILDFYYISGENFDDSNMQSSIVNGMSDVLDDVNSGSYSFLPRPCIEDTDAPLFTWYASGASYNASTDSGFYFTIYDYTWAVTLWLNSTEHYRFEAGTPDISNLVSYVPVAPGSGIDNQEGVNSGSITVYLSWISPITLWNLLAPIVLHLSDLDCSFVYDGPWYPLTWNRKARWYRCFVPFAWINFETSQIVEAIISGVDYQNISNQTHTWSISFSFSLIKLGTIFDLKAYPGSRAWGDYSNRGVLRFYDANKSLIRSGIVATNSSWLATVQVDSLSNGIYYVVYKWQSHLASYLSWISVTVWSVISLDFTTWSNLFNTQNQSLSQDDGFQRQIAGDLKSTNNKYDYTVNGNDIAILTLSGFIDAWIDVLDPKNLNADVAINVSDISVIGVNFQLKDPFHVTYSGDKFTR
jgi:hypothetical protein